MLSSPHQTTRGRTLFLSSMYRRSDMITSGVDAQGNPIYPRKIQQHFEELSKYGEIESLNVCDNLADHMFGDVNVQFREQERASNALQNLTGRASQGFSPVTGFCEATWIHEQNVCNRGGLLGPGVRGSIRLQFKIIRKQIDCPSGQLAFFVLQVRTRSCVLLLSCRGRSTQTMLLDVRYFDICSL
ncbi:U2 SNRNP AUXILIARY FACTOR SMALL SUBUNIT [Salix koriyanagi]|uniref:U2 SNRNP AUXILIARY FACTOR SMALL SUBUNIT n=1 Tax=Salix koriyanagi TaxID=2511006 RepID=A0A9Q0TSM6_9ROSI|nr:U2 SNRNP AUXILIARY FACTOR SMALL SUBUNIT [Salix koriyanagi]